MKTCCATFLLVCLVFAVTSHTEEDFTCGENTSSGFRDYENAKQHVKDFYSAQHQQQTLQFSQTKLSEYTKFNRVCKSVWDTLEYLDHVIDESDPDLELGQLTHALQTAEKMRADGMPDWFVLTGLIHDLGKILLTFGEPQWAVVGDTYPLGMPFSDKIVLRQLGFDNNPDSFVAAYQTSRGIYSERIGLSRVTMTFGHDEYLYQVAKAYSSLPKEALFVIRFHSFYPLHKENAYVELLSEEDKEMLPWVKEFSRYDLYTKDNHLTFDVEKLRPYYQSLIAKYFPRDVCW